MNPETVLITGSNRGIGLQLVKGFLELPSPPRVLIAACRNPDKAQDLQTLATKFGNLKLLRLDILNQLDDSSLKSLEHDVRSLLGCDSLNLLINNAGVGVFGEDCDLQTLKETFTVNAFGPLLVTKALIPLLKNAASKSQDVAVSLSRSGVINVSSRGGSIADNQLGGNYEYRGSKSAVNMFTKNLSLEYAKDGVLILIIEPGPVITDMSKSFVTSEEVRKKFAAHWQTTEESVENMMKVMVKCGEEDQGKYLSYKGEQIPW